MSKLVSYAQNREDIIIHRFFDDLKKGTYIDVGANHPEHYSVTKFFYDRGWTGVNIEPIKRLHQLFVEKRPKDINLNMAIGEDKGSLVLREYVNGDGLSTLSEDMKRDYESTGGYNTERYIDYKVRLGKLTSLFDKYKLQDAQFIKIDVEGYEYEVLKSNNWKKYRPELVCIEANHVTKDWREILLSNGYSLVFFDGINEYYLRSESLYRLDNFKKNYVSTVLANGVIDIEVVNQQKDNELYLLKKIEHLELECSKLEQEFLRPKSVKESLIILAGAIHRKNISVIHNLEPKKMKLLERSISIDSNLDNLILQITRYDLENQKLIFGGYGLSAVPYRIILRIYKTTVKLLKSLARRFI